MGGALAQPTLLPPRRQGRGKDVQRTSAPGPAAGTKPRPSPGERGGGQEAEGGVAAGPEAPLVIKTNDRPKSFTPAGPSPRFNTAPGRALAPWPRAAQVFRRGRRPIFLVPTPSVATRRGEAMR